MTTIRIPECTSYTRDAFLDILRAEKEAVFNIIIPKVFGDEPGMIDQDYWRAIYVGQLLGNLCPGISHTLPAPESPGEFAFLVKTGSIEELADVLAYIQSAYSDEEEAYVRFDLDAAEFMSRLHSEDIIHCPAMLGVLNKYG